jgi:hypothetical protein
MTVAKERIEDLSMAFGIVGLGSGIRVAFGHDPKQ